MSDLRRHTSETGVQLRASIGPSGKSGVWEKRTLGQDAPQIWYFDLDSMQKTRLGERSNFVYSHPLLSPDGKFAAYRAYQQEKQLILLQPVTGGPPKRICEDCGIPGDWTSDGGHMFYTTGGEPARVGLLEVASGRFRDLIKHPSYNLYGVRSRVDASGDGLVALYADNGPRTRQIFLVRLHHFVPAEQDHWIAATDGAHWDQSPAWSPDGRTLYYVTRHDGVACIMARALDSSGQPEGNPWAVSHFHTPDRTLMRSVRNRGADALWATGDRLYFMLDNRASELWSINFSGNSK